MSCITFTISEFFASCGSLPQHILYKPSLTPQLPTREHSAKTVEEFLIKSDQSIPPYIRLLKDSFDAAKSCTKEPIPYPADYQPLVRSLVRRLRELQGGLPDGGVLLGPPFEFKPHNRNDYPLYLFAKLRVANREEWDEEAYLKAHPDAKKAVQDGKYQDGIHHFFVEGFDAGRKSC